MTVRVALIEVRTDYLRRPQMIILKTTIAKGIAEVAGTNKGHGEEVARPMAGVRLNLKHAITQTEGTKGVRLTGLCGTNRVGVI